MRMTDAEVEERTDLMVPKAKELATELGHAAVIVRRGTQFYVADSWTDVEGRPLRLVSPSGSVVRL